MTYRYKSFYGSTYSITEHRNGKATLKCYENGKRTKKEYKSLSAAKRALSRRCDGMPSLVI